MAFNPFVPSTRTGGPTFNPQFQFGPNRYGLNCAPVTILDTNGNTLATVVSGGSYTVSPPTFVRTLTFKPGSTGVQRKISFVAHADGLVTATLGANVASVVFYNVTTFQTLTSPYTVTNNDIINVTVTPVNPALDTVVTLTGVFSSITTSNTFPEVGLGDKMYCLNIPDRTVSVNNLAVNTFPNLATIALSAITHGSIAYRHIDQSAYVFGFSGINNLTVERISTVTDTLVQTTPFVITNVGITTILACYDWINDKFYIVGGGGATTPFVTYDPVTNTCTAAAALDLLSYVHMVFLGYADYLEGCFLLTANGIAGGAYKPLGSDRFQARFLYTRGGAIGAVFNPNNRQLYMTNSTTAVRVYNPEYIPELRSVGAVNIANSGLSIDVARNTIWGCAINARTIGWIDETNLTTGGFTAPLVGAETGFRAVKYNSFCDKVFATSRNGNIIRVTDAATRLLDATTPTIAVGNQITTNAGSWNTLCFNKIQVY